MANLIPEPESLDSPLWTKANTTVTADQGVAPDGTNTADDVIHLGSAAALYDVLTVDADTTYFLSAFIHVGDTGPAPFVRITYRSNSGNNGIQGWFDLSNDGELTSTDLLGAGATFVGAGVKDMGSGWYWAYVSGVLPLGDTSSRTVFAIVGSDGSETEISTSSAYIWGVILDKGGAPLSYESVGGTEFEWNDEQSPAFLAIGRRMLDQPPTKRVYPKPKTSMRDL